jgi:hypothetical protein
MMFGSVSEHFFNLRHVKRCKTCVSALNALFWGTEVANNPFYYIRPRCLGVFQRIFTNLWHVKRCKTCVWGTKCTILGTEVARQPLYWIKTKMHYFGVSKLRSIHSTPLDPKWCLGVFRGIEVAKHSFYPIRPKMMFGSVSRHFANLRHVKRC